MGYGFKPDERARRVWPPALLLATLAVLVGWFALATPSAHASCTTVVCAATYAYDDPALARVDLDNQDAVEASSTHV
jgi:hypothetical protein